MNDSIELVETNKYFRLVESCNHNTISKGSDCQTIFWDVSIPWGMQLRHRTFESERVFNIVTYGSGEGMFKTMLTT
jgi:hypothetical protein